MKLGPFIVILAFIYINAAIARQPAIEPGGIEISIDEIEHPKTAPENWPNFKNPPVDTKQVINSPKTFKRKRTIKTVTLEETQDTITPPIYLAILIILLPFSIMAGILLPLGKKGKDNNIDNVEQLHKNRDDDNDDFDWPKAG